MMTALILRATRSEGLRTLRCRWQSTAAAHVESSLARHVFFGAGFGLASFAALAFCEEDLGGKRGSLLRHVPSTPTQRSEEVRKWRASLGLAQVDPPSITDRLKRLVGSMFGPIERPVLVISAINVTVFGLWQVASMRRRGSRGGTMLSILMTRKFMSHPGSRDLLPHVTSAFSHRSLLHLVLNTVGLMFLGSSVCRVLSSDAEFYWLYLNGAVVSSIASWAYYTFAMRAALPSLGASGAVYALAATYAHFFPEDRFGLIFLPGVYFALPTLLSALSLFELGGMLMRSTFQDHTAHLFGLLMGYIYPSFVQKHTWQNSETFVKRFRQWLFRSAPGSP